MTIQYCDVFGRMPSLLGNLKLDTPVVARQPKVKHLPGYARDSVLSPCVVAWQPWSNGYMDTLATKYCCVYIGCIATSSGKASVSIPTARCYKGKAIRNS
jgi:hypothetical protein